MEKHPLIDDAIKRNEDELVNTPPGTPQYQLYTNRVDRHRHESIMAMLEDISKPKRIEKAVLLVGIISIVLVSIGLYFQVRQFYGSSQHNPPLSDTIHKEQNTEESGQKTPQVKSNNAKDLRGSHLSYLLKQRLIQNEKQHSKMAGRFGCRSPHILLGQGNDKRPARVPGLTV